MKLLLEVDGSHLGKYTINTKTNFHLKISQQTNSPYTRLTAESMKLGKC